MATDRVQSSCSIAIRFYESGQPIPQKSHADGLGTCLIIAPNVVTFANSDLISALAARYRVPAIYPFAFYAKAGGLVSYAYDAAEQFRQGAGYVDRLLKAAKPADLPVQHPSKFELVINLNTAKTLGLDVPPQMLSLADEVIW
jgi:putative ABC transport system substrate-binding protein